MLPPLLQVRPIQGAAFSDCPEEILDLIMSYLEGTNLKRCRLVSQKLHCLATLVLFARVTVDCYHFGLHDLAELAATDHLAPLVQEIAFDINDLSIRALLQRLRQVHSRSSSKCHTNMLHKLKKRSKVLGILKPCYDILPAMQEKFYTDILPCLISAFRSFSGLRRVRILDAISDRRQIKPLVRGFCSTIFGMGFPVLLLKDHWLRRLPSSEFQGTFSATLLFALQLSNRRLEYFDGFCPVARDLVASRVTIAATYPELLEQVDAGEIHIPPTITDITLRFHHDSFINLGSAGVTDGLIPIVKAFRHLLSTTDIVEVLRIEVLDAPHQTLNIEYFFNQWLKDNTKALPRLRVL